MSAEKIKADYSQLTEIAKIFDQQADIITQQLQKIKQQTDRLQSGDWEGVGATAFFTEMNDVISSFDRLRLALTQAVKDSYRISQRFKQAEADSAKLLLMTGANIVRGGFDTNTTNEIPHSNRANGVLDDIQPSRNNRSSHANGVLDDITPNGGDTPPPNPAAQLQQSLEQQYHITITKGNKDWSKEDLEDLQKALGRLNVQEKQKIAGMKFDRWDKVDNYRTAHPKAKIPKSTGGVTDFESDGKTLVISMLDQGFDHPRMMGTVKYNAQIKYGVPFGVYNILHEVGHAHEFSDPSEGVLKDFQKAMGNKPPMTDYAKTDSHESFAEAYAIYKADPNFVKQNYPDVYQFFQNNQHLKQNKK